MNSRSDSSEIIRIANGKNIMCVAPSLKPYGIKYHLCTC